MLALGIVLAFVVYSDVRRPAFHPTWPLYIGLLGAILVVMGYSVDSQWVTVGTQRDGGDDP